VPILPNIYNRKTLEIIIINDKKKLYFKNVKLIKNKPIYVPWVLVSKWYRLIW